ncbi:hypothetical protein BHE74_00003745 [Ensete ventricosum]|nr:hypothetical protein BHE74_00003745 [Ensete ventricosum]
MPSARSKAQLYAIFNCYKDEYDIPITKVEPCRADPLSPMNHSTTFWHLKEGLMLQERSALGNLKEDVPLAMQPTSEGAPQPPPPLPLFGDGNSPSRTLGWYWRLFNDPGLTPLPLNLGVSAATPKAFQGLTNQV